MSDPALALSDAIVKAVKESTLGVQVYDRVPKSAAFPYISLGPIQTIEDGADCVDGTQVHIALDVWSRGVGKVEAKGIASSLRLLLHGADLALVGGFELIKISHQDTRHLSDPDGLTSHSIVSLRALIDRV